MKPRPSSHPLTRSVCACVCTSQRAWKAGRACNRRPQARSLPACVEALWRLLDVDPWGNVVHDVVVHGIQRHGRSARLSRALDEVRARAGTRLAHPHSPSLFISHCNIKLHLRDNEVVWENVRVLSDGETVSVDGTHLGHNLVRRALGRGWIGSRWV